MSFTNAKNYLNSYGLENNIIELNESSATVADAAHALHCTEAEIAKSLAFIVNDKPILIVVSGNSKIDNGKFKAEFNTKAKMIPFDEVEPKIGHAVGGVCPFGINQGVEVFLDTSLKQFSTVYPACGSSNSAVKLTLDELIRTSNYTRFVDVCKSN